MFVPNKIIPKYVKQKLGEIIWGKKSTIIGESFNTPFSVTNVSRAKQTNVTIRM